MNIEYKIGFSSQKQIHNLLEGCDKYFIPKLSEKVDIAVYAKKIFDNAINFEAWDGDGLIGLLAMYVSNKNAYITNVSVANAFVNKGIASDLLKNCIEYANENKFDEIELEVNEKNAPALFLYTKFGFEVYEEKNFSKFMRIKLEAKNV